MKDIAAIVLAAGRGTRMKSETPKVMHEILGKPMISYVLDSLRGAGIDDIVVVAGFGGKRLAETLKGVKTVMQKELLGSGDAVNTAKKALGAYSGDILVIYGDTPLIKSITIENLVERHKSSAAGGTILTTVLKDPRGYGRIVRNPAGEIVRIVEDAEARLYEQVIEEVNVGLYCFKTDDLFALLARVRPENKKKEYYLTDTIGILYKEKKTISSIEPTDAREIIGVNSRRDLAEAGRLLKEIIAEEIMAEGVTIEDPSSTTIYPGVEIGVETIIHPNTIIESDVEIGKNCRIGPFAHLRGGVSIGDRVEIGNFVELVRTKVGDGTRIKHHTYLGDTAVGKDVNIGAGTITANFDGKRKNKTVIEDASFIGIGAKLIAPVRIGKGAVVGAGSVIPKNHNVPKGATVAGVPAKVLKNKA
jgi:bifunctional UDP-N-acetylglucosamine pyrophosphorylase/glucosamine-1-phosphate N-acetyltransferase